jgi:3-isopropylmalate/(R)-2-methylmalate dehydratase small subunit
MSTQPVRHIRSRTAVLPLANVDTDQIIPARFLRATTREGFGERLFADWRYDTNGAPRPEFLLNRAESRGCNVLVAGRNFGCGSSREHAAWALLDYGFRAVISTEFADIFRSNALKNGLVPVLVDEATSAWLSAHPGAEVSIDLESCTLELPDDVRVGFPIEPFARYCLVNGVDELGFLLGKLPQIEAFERNRTRP